MSFFLSVIGMVLIIEGIPYFCFPNQVKSLSQKLPNMPNGQIRGIGLSLMLFGLIVIFFGKN